MSYKHLALNSRTAAVRHQMGVYKFNTRFYNNHLKKMNHVPISKGGQSPSAIPVDRNFWQKPQLDEKFQSPLYKDEKVDYSDKEHLDTVEVMREVMERDHYQDHSYHNEWIQRDLNLDQKRAIQDYLGWMQPGYQVEPWVWHPGDQVEIVSGEFAGQRGTILNVVAYKNQAFVQNVNVKPIVIPASDTRPEQTIQREHPIDVRDIKLVDPTNNEAVDVRLVTVRDKKTGEKVKRRMSLATGALLPIPQAKPNVELGDPMHDTPLEDARGETYMADKEQPVMVARKIRAMEDHFTNDLKESYTRHAAYRAENTQYLRAYQRAVVVQAAGFVMESLIAGAAPGAAAAAAEDGATEVELEGLARDGEVPLGLTAVEEAEAARAAALQEMVQAPHWQAAVEGVELPEFDESEIEDLHGRLSLDNSRQMRHSE